MSPCPDLSPSEAEAYAFKINKLTRQYHQHTKKKTQKRCQWRTFSNLWHFLFWLETPNLSKYFKKKIYILYINIWESYLRRPRRLQMYKLCPCPVGSSDVVPLLFAPRSSGFFKWLFSSAAIIKTTVLKLNERSLRQTERGNICTPVLFHPSC